MVSNYVFTSHSKSSIRSGHEILLLCCSLTSSNQLERPAIHYDTELLLHIEYRVSNLTIGGADLQTILLSEELIYKLAH
jgi:hypothetical protein